MDDWMLSPEDQEQGKDVSSFLFNMVLKILASEIKQEKNAYRIEGRNKTVPICRWHDFLCRKSQGIHTHTHTHTHLELICEFSKVTGHKINIQKSIMGLPWGSSG